MWFTFDSKENGLEVKFLTFEHNNSLSYGCVHSMRIISRKKLGLFQFRGETCGIGCGIAQVQAKAMVSSYHIVGYFEHYKFAWNVVSP